MLKQGDLFIPHRPSQPHHLAGVGQALLQVLRACQEAPHNVERHSRASRVRVNLNYEPQRIQLVVADNGKGMPPATLDALANESKLGLMGMQERARAAGGKLTIRSTPGAGTKVIVEAPHSGPA